MTDPTIAYLTPVTLPRRREGTRNTLSPPPSPSLHRSFSLVHDDDAAAGMDIDDDSNSSSSGGSPQTITPVNFKRRDALRSLTHRLLGTRRDVRAAPRSGIINGCPGSWL